MLIHVNISILIPVCESLAAKTGPPLKERISIFDEMKLLLQECILLKYFSFFYQTYIASSML